MGVVVVQFFFETMEFDHQFSSSFITHIPNVGCLNSLNNFKPISILS